MLVTFFHDFSYLSLLICVQNPLGLACQNMKTKKKAVRRIPTNDIDLRKNRLLPNVDTVEVHLDSFSGEPDGPQNHKNHTTSQKQKEYHTLPVNYQCGERSAMLLRETFEPMLSDTDTERFTQVRRTLVEIPSMCHLSTCCYFAF